MLQLLLDLSRLRQFAAENIDLPLQIGNGGNVSAHGRWPNAAPRLLSRQGSRFGCLPRNLGVVSPCPPWPQTTTYHIMGAVVHHSKIRCRLAVMGHQLPRRQHGRCGSKTSDSGHEQGQSARQKRARTGLSKAEKTGAGTLKSNNIKTVAGCIGSEVDMLERADARLWFSMIAIASAVPAGVFVISAIWFMRFYFAPPTILAAAPLGPSALAQVEVAVPPPPRLNLWRLCWPRKHRSPCRRCRCWATRIPPIPIQRRTFRPLYSR